MSAVARLFILHQSEQAIDYESGTRTIDAPIWFVSPQVFWSQLTLATLGIDLAFEGLYHLANHSFYDWVVSFMTKYGRTIELDLVGKRLLITDEPENVRSIMYSQVSAIPSALMKTG